MNQWLELPKYEILKLLNNATMEHLQSITKYSRPLISKSKIGSGKANLINLFAELLQDEKFKLEFYKILCVTEESKKLYFALLWEQTAMSKEDSIELLGRDVTTTKYQTYGFSGDKLDDEFALVSFNGRWGRKKLYIDPRIRTILKLIHPAPDDMLMPATENPEKTKYHYSNEENILSVINTISEMYKTNLINIGKTAEKPLAKTLNIIKNTTTHNDFYKTSKIDNLAIDMLVRSFYFYNMDKNVSKIDGLERLKKFIFLQFADRLSYSISRVFFSHLKKVKYDPYSNNEKKIFSLLKEIIKAMPKDAWVESNQLINFCTYRDISIDLDSEYETTKYFLDVNPIDGNEWDNKIYAEDDNYNAIILEPVIKALFFYLGALGAVELKYDDPVSSRKLTAKAKPYISLWDGLRYVKLTDLGKYLFGFTKNYKVKKVINNHSKVKFDEYKPVITIEKSNFIMIAKLEPYTELHDNNKYTLSYKKIFQGCSTKKLLKIKIDNFYTLFDEPIPVLYDNYFDDILSRANLLKTNSDQIVIELKNDKRLLDLFMQNKKIQEFIIKASGYRVIVSNANLQKLSRIVKDNGFFIEF